MTRYYVNLFQSLGSYLIAWLIINRRTLNTVDYVLLAIGCTLVAINAEDVK